MGGKFSLTVEKLSGIMPDMQVCRKCLETKSLEDFYRVSRDSAKRNSMCKKCSYIKSLAWRRNNKDKIATYSLKRQPNWHRAYTLAGYGLTLQEYELWREKQQGVCAICKLPCATGKSLSVDHDHHTGKVRGLLCMMCNTAIGKLGDSVELLKNAIEYLEGGALC